MKRVLERISGVVLLSALLATQSPAAVNESPGSAFRRGDFAQAVRLLKPQAEAGQIDAQIMLGQMYLKGQGVPADVAAGIAWIRKAADQGSPIAAYDLGLFSANGIGAPQDIHAAATWYRKAAHQGFPDAAFNLAVLYHKGVGLEQSDAMALRWADAAIDYLPVVAPPELRSRFESLRATIQAGMPADQAAAAARLVSPDGPLRRMVIRNADTLQKKGSKEYPLGLRELGRGGTVVALARVRVDGTIADVVIETSSGHAEIDAATQRLLALAEVEPQVIDGQPAESWQIMRWVWSATEEPWNSFANLNKMPLHH